MPAEIQKVMNCYLQKLS